MQTIVIDENRVRKPFHKHWQFCVGSGHAALAMRADYAKQLKRVHDELGITRVRFHGIMNDDLHTMPAFDEVLPFPGAERIRERSFYHCGVVYDNVLATGMKPFVELSFMPEVFARNKERGKLLYGSLLCMPKELEAWAEHITAFVEYLIRRYGKEEVESWYFEVWNEPDLTNAFFDGTQTEYFKLYEATARAIKAVDEKLLVGGPATSGSRWVDEFIQFCEENYVPIDFVSTHQYAGDPFIGVKESEVGKQKETEEDPVAQFMQLQDLFKNIPEGMTHLQLMRMIMGDPSEKEDIPNDRFRKNAAVVRAQAKNYPVIYNEWNCQAVFSAKSNDTRKTAAYIVKTAIDVEENVDESSVWCFSDIFEELHQFTEEFHGGFGLQTIHGIAKPSFYALKLLAMLANERVELAEGATDGEIGVAAFEDEEKMQLLLFRQKMKQLELPPEEIRVSVKLDKIPECAKMYRIDEGHCNPLALWEAMGSPKDLTPKEVEQIELASAMEEESLVLQEKAGYAQFAVALGVNDVYLIVLEK